MLSDEPHNRNTPGSGDILPSVIGLKWIGSHSRSLLELPPASPAVFLFSLQQDDREYLQSSLLFPRPRRKSPVQRKPVLPCDDRRSFRALVSVQT